MAVFKRQGTPNYWVGFEHRGRRYRQSSGTASLRLAEQFEIRLRQTRVPRPDRWNAWRGAPPQTKPFANPHGAWTTTVVAAGLHEVRMHEEGRSRVRP